MTTSMVQVWFETQEKFTVESQPHYLYSPRELSRWFDEELRSLEDEDARRLTS